jgi:hypothetical protein
MIGGQKIQVGLAHARKTAEISVEADTCQGHRRTRHHHHRAAHHEPGHPAAQGL